MTFKIIQIPQDDQSIRLYVGRYKAFRLLSLQTSPEAFGSTYARETAFADNVWSSHLSNPQAATFIALQSDRIVSTITVIGPLPYDPDKLSPLDNPWATLDGRATTADSHWRVNGMFTLPEARGQGIARALLEAAKKFGVYQAEASAKDLVISIAVDEDNAPARSLYERCGFVTIKDEINHGDWRNVLLMKYTPGSS